MRDEDLQETNLKLVNEAYRLRKTDRIKSFLTLENFAKTGSKASIVYLSDMFRRGVKIDNIVERAQYLNKIAKDKNLFETSFLFGIGFYNLEEYASAYDAFSWGAENGYAPSIYRLGSMYLLGKHVNQDYTQARRILELASKKGNVMAKRDLCHVLLLKQSGFSGKVRGSFIFLTLIFYQFNYIYLKIKKIPLDERFYQ